MTRPPFASIIVDGLTMTVRVSDESAIMVDEELSVTEIDDASKLESVPM